MREQQRSGERYIIVTRGDRLDRILQRYGIPPTPTKRDLVYWHPKTATDFKRKNGKGRPLGYNKDSFRYPIEIDDAIYDPPKAVSSRPTAAGHSSTVRAPNDSEGTPADGAAEVRLAMQKKCLENMGGDQALASKIGRWIRSSAPIS